MEIEYSLWVGCFEDLRKCNVNSLRKLRKVVTIVRVDQIVGDSTGFPSVFKYLRMPKWASPGIWEGLQSQK